MLERYVGEIHRQRNMAQLALALYSAKQRLTAGTNIDFKPRDMLEAQQTAWRLCVAEIGKVLADSNPRFKQERFVTACVGGPKTTANKAVEISDELTGRKTGSPGPHRSGKRAIAR